ncbi:MAG: sigma-54 dependent transcriptional regulator [Candidatus Aminicenantes bacterium]|nr:sigma-54 dependent transcriptional regulator [Candidatus Aminicenantes bacterium]MDH5383147.1 sigma-54 dependent transcriptional regulator [Candidatus Aminicenantes bacterium]MDH5742191.1 sigma-54 dependent transcriptional regulator [Candidatus Aminicenantes bacterium]
MEKILIIDDEKSILDLLNVVFEKEGYSVETSLSATRAVDLIDKQDFDLIISDIKMPKMSGMELLRYVRENRPDIPIVMITAYGTIKQAVEALKAGATDYVVKPFDVEELKIIAAQGLEKKRLKEENIFLRKELKEKYDFENMVGKSKTMKEIYNLIEKVAVTDSTVLITGESGTGKEVAARAVHFLSARRERSFVSINCGALPENLLESELFGHVKGSFTGAVATKKGMFEVAEKGTLFLDEVSEMSPWTQVKLLRALQDRKIRRVGGTEEIPVDVRIIAATNQDLKQRIEDGRFREDLFYRLNVISFDMPPLRKRKEDIPLLVTLFLEKFCNGMGRPIKRIAPEVFNVFESYPWPGNVRELENMIERAVAIEERETITKESLPKEMLLPNKKQEIELSLQSDFDLNAKMDEISSNYVQQALLESRGNLKEAASLLGINYRSMRYLIEKHALKDVNRVNRNNTREKHAV